MGKTPKGQNRVRLEQYHLDMIRAEIARTGVGLHRRLRKSDDVPNGLNLGQVQNWLDGRNTTVRRDHLEWVLAAWRNFPDNAAPKLGRPRGGQTAQASQPQRQPTERQPRQIRVGRVHITPEIVAELRAHQKRTGIGPSALLRNKRREQPPGLNSHTIMTWLSGEVVTARKDHFYYVRALWRNLPDGSFRVDLTPEVIAEMRECRKRSGLGAYSLFDTFGDDYPQGLSPELIQSWVHGATRTARKDYVDFVLALWRDASTAKHMLATKKKQGSNPRRSTMTEITPEIIEKLASLKRETGISAATLLRRTPTHDRPSGLEPKTVNRWMSGKAVWAREEDLDYMLTLWRQVRDQGGLISRRVASSLPQGWVDITPALREKLVALREASGVGPSELLRGLDLKPTHVPMPAFVEGWLSGSITLACKDQLEFVLDRWRAKAKENA